MAIAQSVGGRSVLFILTLVLVGLSSKLSAGITMTGDTSPSYLGADPWDILAGTELRIGVTSDGQMTIDLGSSVSNIEAAYLAYGVGTQGEAVITGPGSLWTNNSLLSIGANGLGTMTVSDSGQVYAGQAVLGTSPEASGSVTVQNGASLSVNDDLIVGAWGQGDLTISNGSWIETGGLYIGGFEASEANFDPNLLAEYGPVNGNGQVTVTEGAWLDVYGENTLVVGAGGTGSLTISAGGAVSSTDSYIGGYLKQDYNEVTEMETVEVRGGTGSVQVTGPGSYWETYGLVVGTGGTGSLEVSDGAEVYADFAVLGAAPTATGTVTVQDGDSYLGTNNVVVGAWGQGDLTIANGSWVETNSVYIGGFDADMVGDLPSEVVAEFGEPNGIGAVTVTEGAWLDVYGEDTLVVGAGGTGSLTISAGGGVSAANSYVGGYLGSDYNDVTMTETTQIVTGTGSAQVTGEGSTWQSYTLVVGTGGAGTLIVDQGGQVMSDYGYVGYGEGSDGTVVVTGEGSGWQVAQDLYVGGDSESAKGAGRLIVSDGGQVDVGSSLTIWESGTLSGDGTISVTSPETLYNYGTIAPGNSIGTLTVNTSVVFGANSVYEVEIAGSSSDKLVVNGNVDIEGGTVRAVAAGTVVGTRRYEIIEADSVTGTFEVLDTALLDFYFNDAGLDYDPGSVWLWVDALQFDDPNVTQTRNQAQVGGALQQIAGGGGNDTTDALQGLGDFNDLRRAYDQLSGQSRPPLASLTIAGASKFLGTVTSRVHGIQTGLAGISAAGLTALAGPDSALGSGRTYDVAPQGQSFAVGNGSRTLGDRKWGLWGQGYGLYGDRESEAGTPGYAYDVYGGSFGLDYQFTEKFLAGVVGGFSQGDVDFAGSRDNTDLEALHVGLYGSLACGKWYLDSAATYASLEYETERFIDFTSERLTGDFKGYEIATYVEVGQNWDLAPDLLLQPLVSMQYTYLDLDSYTESGGASALTFEGQTYESVKGSLGARLTKRLIETAGDFRADAQLRGRWVHEFGDDDSSVEAWFAGNPTAVFKVSDEDVARNSAVFGVGLSVEMNEQTRAYVDYDTRLNNEESVQVIRAALQYRW